MIKNRFTEMSRARKRAFALTLAVAVAGTSFNVASIATEASNSREGRVITSFEELPEDIAHQYLPIGSEYADIEFPEELGVFLYSTKDTEKDKKKEKREKEERRSGEKKEEEDEEETSGESGEDKGNEDKSRITTTEPVSETPGESIGPGEDNRPESSETGGEEKPEEADTKDSSEPGDESGTKEEDSDTKEPEDGSSESADTSDAEGRNGLSLFTGVRAMFQPVKAYAAEPSENTEETEDKEPSKEEGEEKEPDGEDAADEPSSEQPAGVKPESDGGAFEEKASEQAPEEKKSGETMEQTEVPSGESVSDNDKDVKNDGKEDEEIPEKLSAGIPGTLENVRWRIDRDRSAYSRFQAIKAGDEFVFIPSIRSNLKVECDLPSIIVTITEQEETVSENSVSEDQIPEDTVSPAFSQMMVIGGVRVSVEAPEGVFPEGSVLHVKKVDGNSGIEEFVRSDMGLSETEESTSDNEAEKGYDTELKLVSFDITISDVSGNEIQPDTEYGEARVTFSQVDLISDYLNKPGTETAGSLTSGNEGGAKKSFRGYHFEDGFDVAESLQFDIDEGENAASVNADHFSIYTLAAGAAEASVSLDECTIKLPQEVYAYTGSEIEPSVSVTYGKKTLAESKDYTLSLSNNVAVASATDEKAPTVTVTGMGNYTGSRELKFTIKELPSGSITVGGTTWNGFQGKNETGITIKTPQSVTIKATGVSSNTIKSVQYVISDTFYGTTKELDASVLSWNTYNDAEKPQITKDGTYYVYAKVTDSGDNVLYLSSKKITKKASNATLKIEVMDHKYDVLQGVQEIDDYTNEMKKITITSSGGGDIWYFITDKFFTSTSEIENEATNSKLTVGTTGTITTTNSSKWSKYDSNSKPGLIRNKLNYIYAKTAYKGSDGNETTVYISSKGIWEDEKKPKVSSIATTPKATTAQVTVKGSDNESGIKDYYLQYKGKDDPAPKAEDVKNSGTKSEDGKYDLSGLKAKTQYVLYAVVTDKAGNISEVKSGKMTTQKDETASAAQKKAAAAAAAAAAAGGGANGSGKTSAGRSGDSGKDSEGQGSSKDKAGEDAKNGTEASAEEENIKTGIPYILDATGGIAIGKANTSGWERITKEIEKATAPAEVTVDMNGETIVPQKLLSDISDQDMTVSFLMGDDITWTVNGLSFTEDTKENIDFRVRKNTKNIPSQLVNEIAGVYPHTNLTLTHTGNFGFTALMRLNLGTSNKGLYANLYYYNEASGGLDFIDSVQISEAGNADFKFTHASDYTVVVRGEALTAKTASALLGSDDGGDEANNVVSATNSVKAGQRLWIMIISVVSLALCGLILFLPDRKRKARTA